MEHCVAKEASPHRARLGAYDLTAKLGPSAACQVSGTKGGKADIRSRLNLGQSRRQSDRRESQIRSSKPGGRSGTAMERLIPDSDKKQGHVTVLAADAQLLSRQLRFAVRFPLPRLPTYSLQIASMSTA